MRMAASLVAHRRAAHTWPSRVFDPEDGFCLTQPTSLAGVYDIGELRVTEEPFHLLQRRLALAGIALRTIARACALDEGGMHSTVHKLHVELSDLQKQLDSLLDKNCPEH